MNFSKALEMIKAGSRMKREGWNASNQWVAIQRPTDLSKMTLPYLFIKTAQDNLVPWLASQSDLLAEDWEEVGTEPFIERRKIIDAVA